MKEILDFQKQSFIENGPPSHKQRVDSLRRCVALIEKNEMKFIDALNHDFSKCFRCRCSKPHLVGLVADAGRRQRDRLLSQQLRRRCQIYSFACLM